MMILTWRRGGPPMSLRWRGPNRITSIAIHNLDQVTEKIAVIAGPRGPKGDQGNPGITTIQHEYVVPTVLNGGDF